MRIRVCLLFLVALLTGREVYAQNAWGDTPYGAYSHFPHGSDRAMALGGAAVSYLDDPSSILFNPAGAAFGKWKADIGTTNNRIDHQELAYNFPDTYGVYETKYDSPYSYFFYSGAARLGTWVIGAGYSSPYFYEFADINPISNLEVARFELKVRSYDTMIAKRIGDYFAVGIAGHSEQVREYYDNKSLPAPVPAGFEATGSGQYFSWGAAFRMESFGVGVSHSDRRMFTLDKSANTILENYNTFPFRDVVIPARTSFGFFVKPFSKLMLTVDMDVIEKLDRAVYVSAASTSTEYLITEEVRLYHGGAEWTVFDGKYFDFILRGGGYTEPTRVMNGRSRTHQTYGAQLRAGPAVVSYGADTAPNFSNSAISFGLSLGAI